MTEDRNRPTATSEADDSASPTREPLKVTFSLPQIIGGALAAATAAALGSTLGVAGTVIGASVASIIGGVAGTLYSAGIDRTHRTVTAAIKRGYDRVSVVQPSDAETAATAEGMPEAPDADEVEVTVAPPAPAPASQRRRLLVRMGVTAVAIFAVAGAVITVIELTTGHSLDGSQGTTVGQVSKPRPQPSATAVPTPTTTPTPAPVPTASETTPVPSEPPTPTPTVPVEPSLVPTPVPTQS